jgi:hypothetical protein
MFMQLVVDPSYPHCEETVEGVVRSVFFTLAFLLLASLTAQQNSAARQTPLVLTHVVVIDVTRGQAQPDRTVVIMGEYIGEIGESLKIAVPKDSQVVDATGKFLIQMGPKKAR